MSDLILSLLGGVGAGCIDSFIELSIHMMNTDNQPEYKLIAYANVWFLTGVISGALSGYYAPTMLQVAVWGLSHSITQFAVATQMRQQPKGLGTAEMVNVYHLSHSVVQLVPFGLTALLVMYKFK